MFVRLVFLAECNRLRNCFNVGGILALREESIKIRKRKETFSGLYSLNGFIYQIKRAVTSV